MDSHFSTMCQTGVPDEWATTKCGIVRKFCSNYWNEINKLEIKTFGLGSRIRVKQNIKLKYQSVCLASNTLQTHSL